MGAFAGKVAKHIAKKGAGKHAGKQKFGGDAGIFKSMQALFASAKGGQKRQLVKGKGKGNKKTVPAAASPNTSKYMDKLAKIDASRKVWVGGLNESTTWKQLEAHFKDVAKPSVTEIMRKGKACLAFKTEDDAQSAIASLNGTELKGSVIEVDVWTQKEKKDKADTKTGKLEKTKIQTKFGAKTGKVEKTRIQTKFGAKGAKGEKAAKKIRGDPKLKEKLAKVDDSLKVWVGGLAEETNFGALRKHFTEAGCKPHLTNLTGRDRACLSFKTTDEVEAAISSLNGTTLDERTLEVDVWTKIEKKGKSD